MCWKYGNRLLNYREPFNLMTRSLHTKIGLCYYQEVLFSKCWQFRKMFKEKFVGDNHENNTVSGRGGLHNSIARAWVSCVKGLTTYIARNVLKHSLQITLTKILRVFCYTLPWCAKNQKNCLGAKTIISNSLGTQNSVLKFLLF